MRLKSLYLLGAFLLLPLCLSGQNFVLKTNLPGWFMASLNVEPEVRLASRHTLALGVSYNGWDMNRRTNMKWRHIFVQPEYRYWLCSAFNGHFIAAHAAYMHYNIGGITNYLNLDFARKLNERRYQGDFYSLGVGYGYHWMITNRFSMEAELGLGVAYTDADSYYCETCGDYIETVGRWFFSPTKLSVSFVWVII